MYYKPCPTAWSQSHEKPLATNFTQEMNSMLSVRNVENLGVTTIRTTVLQRYILAVIVIEGT
jgi:hypothetical protein